MASDDFKQYGKIKFDDITDVLSKKAPLSHKHKKSEISDFPTSMPASDVYDWAKASSKPSYSWSEIDSKPIYVSSSDTNCIVFSNGFKIQWGIVNAAPATITFPVPFSGTKYSVNITTNNNTGANVLGQSIQAKTTTSFYGRCYHRSGGSQGEANEGFDWCATGY